MRWRPRTLRLSSRGGRQRPPCALRRSTRRDSSPVCPGRSLSTVRQRRHTGHVGIACTSTRWTISPRSVLSRSRRLLPVSPRRSHSQSRIPDGEPSASPRREADQIVAAPRQASCARTWPCRAARASADRSPRSAPRRNGGLESSARGLRGFAGLKENDAAERRWTSLLDKLSSVLVKTTTSTLVVTPAHAVYSRVSTVSYMPTSLIRITSLQAIRILTVLECFSNHRFSIVPGPRLGQWGPGRRMP